MLEAELHNCSILPSWIGERGEHGEHGEHGKDRKQQPDDLKLFTYDSIRYIW